MFVILLRAYGGRLTADGIVNTFIANYLNIYFYLLLETVDRQL